MSTHRFQIAGAALLGFSLFLVGCSEKNDSSQTVPSVPVKVATASEKTVPVQISAIGRVEPYSTVSVKAMVSGEILNVHFNEGDTVKKGDLLFTLDPRSYQAALNQARADLAQDLVRAQNARRDAERYRGLVKDGIVTAEQYEQLRTAADALDAAVTADRASVENAEVQLSYCTIRSPLTGRTGDLQLHAGNIVKANADTAMVTINQIAPIYVNFSVPEQELPALRRQLRMHPLPVSVFLPAEPQTPVQGTVTFFDNTVDSTTGTILLKGTFANREGSLWPGAFVNVVVTLDSLPGSVVVPSQAVQTGQQGEYVFVVQPDHTVVQRTVTTGPVYRGETVVASGIVAGETVVTDGQLRLSPGAKVTEVGHQTASGSPQS
jgi:multidrug efflux system membrane fusion protein